MLAKRRLRVVRRTGDCSCLVASCEARRIEGRGSISAFRSLTDLLEGRTTDTSKLRNQSAWFLSIVQMRAKIG